MNPIKPLLWFSRGEAEEAANFYISLFPNSRITNISRYGEAGPGPEGAAMVVEFEVNGQAFMGLNGGPVSDEEELEDPDFKGGISLYYTCATQDELDRLWDALGEDGRILQCGWIIDKYGFAWNLVPQGFMDYITGEDKAGSQRAMREMFTMEKLDLARVKAAYEGPPAEPATP